VTHALIKDFKRNADDTVTGSYYDRIIDRIGREQA
jgi:hypothetical protein